LSVLFRQIARTRGRGRRADGHAEQVRAIARANGNRTSHASDCTAVLAVGNKIAENNFHVADRERFFLPRLSKRWRNLFPISAAFSERTVGRPM
jgi:hypothetical protein